MSIGHDHPHAGHNHSPATDFTKAFALGILLNFGFVLIEAIYGFTAGSMALLADAGHNLSDVLGLVLAWGGAALVKRRPSNRFTYGLKKSSILAALLNALLLLLAIGAIVAEAIRRLSHPVPTDGSVVTIVAAIGILVNGLTAWLFVRGREQDINIRGAYLHMAADALVSAGVVVAGLLISFTGLQWIDPVTSIVVALVVLWGTWGLLTESAQMTLAGVPRGIDPELVGRSLAKLPGVQDVHHLHIWALSTTETALTVHIIVEQGADRDTVLRQANAYAHTMFGIAHSTIQIEDAGCADPHHH